MSRPEHPRDTWPTILSDLKSTLGFSEPGRVSNEIQFREAFERVCAEYKERDVQRLLGTFLRQHGQIVAFAGTIDDNLALQAPENLSSLFWQVSFENITTALNSAPAVPEKRRRLSTCVKELQQLNKALPALGSELALFPEEDEVQRPLQQVFKEYVTCAMAMLAYFATCPTSLSFESFHLRIQDATETFANSRKEWQEMLQKAAAEKDRQMLLNSSAPSFPNGYTGQPIGPFATSARFKWLRTLGKGTYGHVSEVCETTTGTVYAQKLIRLGDDNQARNVIEEQVKNEADIMQRLRHHHIASVIFCVRETDAHATTNAFSMIMLPVGDYDLRHFLEKCIEESFPKEKVRLLDSWFGCLVSALAFAHNQKVKHEDIKPSNILIRENQPYLADFGSAKDFSKSDISVSPDYLVKGTPVYWPPEEKKYRGRPADVFALGCVFSEMLTVRQHRSLEEYRDARHVPDIDNGFAFKMNLPKAREWLENLDGIDKHHTVGHLILEQTLGMLAQDPQYRPEAREIKRRFRAEEEALFCASCY